MILPVMDCCLTGDKLSIAIGVELVVIATVGRTGGIEFDLEVTILDGIGFVVALTEGVVTDIRISNAPQITTLNETIVAIPNKRTK
ncbi:hypothetical protein [Nostoc sp. CALU 546]|uniref:hypothetical protein n=1 Tax=Nostoc sp. CALU 546 TaxID=1867241 RepID=UPI003B67A077